MKETVTALTFGLGLAMTASAGWALFFWQATRSRPMSWPEFLKEWETKIQTAHSSL